MPDFLADIISGTVVAFFMAGLFALLSGYGLKGFGTALLLVFFGSIFTGQGYMAFGVLMVILMIAIGLTAKTYFQQR